MNATLIRLVCWGILCAVGLLGKSEMAWLQAAEKFELQSGIVYQNHGNFSLRGDLYLPVTDSTALRPAIVLIHGGGWAAGNRESGSMSALGRVLAEEGFVAFSIDYRLVRNQRRSPKILNQWPAAIEDCQQAVRWLRENAEKYHIDPEHLGACGDSAGGHLVALLGTTDAAQPGEISTRVQAVVDIFGPADLTQEVASPKNHDVQKAVKNLVDRFLGENNIEAQQAASPIRHINDQAAAFLIFHGTDDLVVSVEQSRAFHKALQAQGVSAELVEFAGEGHGFRPETQRKLMQQTVQFFEAKLK